MRGGGAQMATQVEALLPGAPLLPAEERALVLKPPQDGGREKGEAPMGPDGGPAAQRPPSAKQQKEESNNQEKESLLRAGGEAEEGGEAGGGGAGRREFIEAPPPKVNPWTKNAAALAVNGQSPPGGCGGRGGTRGCGGGDRAPTGSAMRHGVRPEGARQGGRGGTGRAASGERGRGAAGPGPCGWGRPEAGGGRGAGRARWAGRAGGGLPFPAFRRRRAGNVVASPGPACDFPRSSASSSAGPRARLRVRPDEGGREALGCRVEASCALCGPCGFPGPCVLCRRPRRPS